MLKRYEEHIGPEDVFGVAEKNYDPDEEPQILQESETTLKYNASVSIGFFPWIPFADDRKKIPCSADWIVTIVKPQEQLVKLYEEKINGRNESDQSPVVI